MTAVTVQDDLLSEWFRKWRKPLRNFLGHRASIPPSDVDDLAQEVFARLLRYSEAELVENPQGYLFRIASNVATEWRERARIRYPHDDTWLESIEIHMDACPEGIYESEEFAKEVQAAMDTLPPRQNQILRMHVFDEMTYKQIAAELNLTYRIVLRDLTRAYSTLRMTIEKEKL